MDKVWLWPKGLAWCCAAYFFVYFFRFHWNSLIFLILLQTQKTAEYRATGRPRSSRDVHFVANRAAHLLDINVNIQKYTQTYKNIDKYTNMYINIHKSTQIWHISSNLKDIGQQPFLFKHLFNNIKLMSNKITPMESWLSAVSSPAMQKNENKNKNQFETFLTGIQQLVDAFFVLTATDNGISKCPADK